MSRYNNIQTLLDQAENYNQQELVDLLQDEESEWDELAEDIAFVLISLRGMITENTWYLFRDRLTDEIVNVEIKEMFEDE